MKSKRFHLLGDLGDPDLNVEALCWGTGESEDNADRNSMVGKVIGMEDKYSLAKTALEDEEAPEPLALLAIHAAMHMLFLPQFTCDFYEEEAQDDEASFDSDDSSRSGPEGPTLIEEKLAQVEKEKEAFLAKEDDQMLNEAGIKKTRHAEDGILLQPKPACIMWTAGCGIKKKKVRLSSIISVCKA